MTRKITLTLPALRASLQLEVNNAARYSSLAGSMTDPALPLGEGTGPLRNAAWEE